MTKQVTKEEVKQAILRKDGPTTSKFPVLAFDNEEQEITCDNCGNRRAKSFRYNASKASGYDSVIFRWAPNVTRIVARGWYCHQCDWHKLVFEYPRIRGSHRENDPEKIENVELGSTELISEYSGDEDPP